MKSNKKFKLPLQPEEELRHLSTSISLKEQGLQNPYLNKKEKKNLQRQIAELTTQSKLIKDALKKNRKKR